VSGSVALFHRVFDYLDLRPDITDRPGARPFAVSDVRGEVSLHNVWFTYEPDLANGAAPTWALKIQIWSNLPQPATSSGRVKG
jgi:ATP-binding cassette subfamily B protein